MTTPTITGLTTSVTFAENTVNATPQIIDNDVTFTPRRRTTPSTAAC